MARGTIQETATLLLPRQVQQPLARVEGPADPGRRRDRRRFKGAALVEVTVLPAEFDLLE